MRQILKIPRGNPFKMNLCPQRIAPAQQDASFRDITDLSVRLTRHNWDGIDAEFDYTEDGDIIIQVPSVLKCVTYGVELTGTYNGKSWRWADCSVFRVVECNCRSNVHGVGPKQGARHFYCISPVSEQKPTGRLRTRELSLQKRQQV